MARMGRVKLSALVGGALAALSMTGAGYAPVAKAQVTTNQRAFNIPAGPLSQAALSFSEQAGVQLVLGSDVSEGLQASAVQGRYTVGEALDRLLAGSGLEWRYASAGVIAIERPGQTVDVGETGNEVFGTVRVEGAQNLDAAGFGRLDSFGRGAGANGSSDPVSTEGTGSYTTNGSVIGSGGLPRALQQTTQSVTVMTNQRMEEQNLTDLNQIMDFTPGITIETVNGSDQRYLSRGFEITTYSVDGGAPLSFSPGIEGSIDLAEYDRIEVLRGSSGFYGGVGSTDAAGAGGTISLIRKRPLDNEQFLMEIQGGSFANYRVMVDATGPMAFDGRLRGRMVLTAQDRDFHYDITHETRLKAFGSLEFDIGSNTLTRFGGSFQNQLVRGANIAGLPRFFTGDPLPVPVSACICSPFGRQDVDTRELFATFEHRFFNEDWLFKLDATHQRNTGDFLQYTAETRTFSQGIAPSATSATLQGGASTGEQLYDQLAVSAVVNGKFRLFGNDQRLLVGVRRSKSDYTSQNNTYSEERRPMIRFGPEGYSFDPSSFGPRPGPPIPITLSTLSPFPATLGGTAPLIPRNKDTNLRSFNGGRRDSTVEAAFATLNLELVKGLHFEAGLNYTRTSRDGETINLAASGNAPNLQNTSSRSLPIKFSALVPTFSVVYDVAPWLSAYTSYNDIFTPQDFLITREGDPLPPARGQTYEAGLRLRLRDGKLNGHISFYDERVNDQARNDPLPRPPEAPINCCSVITKASFSKGIDAELNGEIFPGFQLAASYTYNGNSTVNTATFGGSTEVLATIFPEHQVKIWASYDFREGLLSGLSLGAGVRAESDRDIIASACVDAACSAGNSFFVFRQKGYATFDGLINYRIDDNIELSANIYNLLDDKYFAQPGSIQGNNFYAPPRSFILTLRMILGDRY